MALERLQARAAAGVPDLDGAVVRPRRQPGRVVREGHRVDAIVSSVEVQENHDVLGYGRARPMQ